MSTRHFAFLPSLLCASLAFAQLVPGGIIEKAAAAAAAASPYDTIRQITAKSSLEGIDADALFGSLPEAAAKLPQTGASRDSFFRALDVAALLSQKSGSAPLIALWARGNEQVAQALRQPAPAGKLVIYKLYNEGTILRTSDVTIGIDIILGQGCAHLAPIFAKELDAMLITHRDGDHRDTKTPLLEELQKAGKPVIIPDEDDTAPIAGVLASGSIKDVKWTAFRGGHLNLRFSSYYHLRIGPWTILHSGDNTRWREFVRTEYARNIDVFFCKPEAVYGMEKNAGIQEALPEILQALSPGMVVPHHLLELGHGLSAYGHDMGIRLRNQVPAGSKVMMLEWGESIVIPQPANSNSPSLH